MTRPSLRLAGRLLSVAAFALATGCALFQDLDSSPYQPVEAGVVCSDAGTGDASVCRQLQVTCDPACGADTVCCVVPTTTGMFNGTCTAPSACGGAGILAFALCGQDAVCPDGGACLAQSCGGITVHACVLVPGCKEL